MISIVQNYSKFIFVRVLAEGLKKTHEKSLKTWTLASRLILPQEAHLLISMSDLRLMQT